MKLENIVILIYIYNSFLALLQKYVYSSCKTNLKNKNDFLRQLQSLLKKNPPPLVWSQRVPDEDSTTNPTTIEDTPPPPPS